MSPAASPPLAVRVPASTSNLGPGFDLVGLALSLFLEARLDELRPGTAPATLAELEGTAAAWPRSADNLLVRAFDLAFSRLGGEGAGVLSARSEIPRAGGFGSSGAAVAAGLLLGSAAAPRDATPDELLAWGVELEGHPDNVAASLRGGLTLCHPNAGPEGRPLVLRSRLAPSIAIALAWPERSLTTSASRGVLPDAVPFADAVENPRRLALLLEGLRSGDGELLAAGERDRLHVPYRLPLIEGAAEALAAARAAGAWLATISGAGSGLIALCEHERAAEVAHALARPLGEGASSRVVTPCDVAPRAEVANG